MCVPKNKILAAFIIPPLFWIYLACTTQMIIGGDAKSFDYFSESIHQKGWIDYLKNGPNREPVYMWLVSVSRDMAENIKLPFHAVLIFFQLLLLFLTLMLTYQLLKSLKINETITAVTLFYLGFSPAILNSALSLYSEIVTYPLMLGIILLSPKAWQAIQTGRHRQCILLGIAMGILASLMTLSKALFEYVFLLFLLPYIFLAVKLLWNKKKYQFINALCFFLITFLIFNISAKGYKQLNKIYNGYYTITDRGHGSFYHVTIERTKKLTTERFLIALTSVPGENVCKSIYGEKKCNDWLLNFHGHDIEKIQELFRAGVPTDQIITKVIKSAIEVILANPLQYLLFASLEGIKMFFWESTKIGFVLYPNWLIKVYDFGLFKNGLRLSMFILTVLSLFSLINYFWKNKRELFKAGAQSEAVQTIFFMLVMIFPFIAMYTCVIVLTRYSFPIVPLYLAGIAFCVHQLLSRKST